MCNVGGHCILGREEAQKNRRNLIFNFFSCLPLLLLFSHSVVSESLWPHGLQHAGFPVLHHHPEFAQTHVHWAGDAIHPSHPLPSPSPPASNLSQHQGLFQCVSSSHQVTKGLDKGLELQLQHQPFQWIFRIYFFYKSNYKIIWSLCSPRDSQESFPAPQFKSINSLGSSLLYGPALTSIHDWENHSFDYTDLCSQSNVSAFLIYCLSLL